MEVIFERLYQAGHRLLDLRAIFLVQLLDTHGQVLFLSKRELCRELFNVEHTVNDADTVVKAFKGLAHKVVWVREIRKLLDTQVVGINARGGGFEALPFVLRGFPVILVYLIGDILHLVLFCGRVFRRVVFALVVRLRQLDLPPTTILDQAWHIVHVRLLQFFDEVFLLHACLLLLVVDKYLKYGLSIDR